MRHPALDDDVAGQLYLPLEQNAFADAYVRLVLHSTLDPSALARIPEIGVQSALGATQGQILGHFLRQGGRMAALGITVGDAGALLLGAALRTE